MVTTLQPAGTRGSGRERVKFASGILSHNGIIYVMVHEDNEIRGNKLG